MKLLISTFLKTFNNLAVLARNFSHLQVPINRVCQPLIENRSWNPAFLLPKPSIVSQVCGFKVKLQLKRRCKDCYFVVRDRRKYVICPTHPRHKQMSIVKKPKYTWIITHASQSKLLYCPLIIALNKIFSTPEGILPEYLESETEEDFSNEVPSNSVR